jgi:histidyl-tRNA synthetase
MKIVFMGRPRKNPGATAVAVSPKKIQILDGMFDAAAETDILWDALLRRLYKMSRVYGFSRVETPLLEDVNLYSHFYGSNSVALQSIVCMLAGGRQVGVRPALLPSVLRAYAQGKTYEKLPTSKWAFVGQTALQDSKTLKLSQDMEFGFEVFGAFNHLTEAQAISVVWEFLAGFGLSDLVLEINSIGSAECQEVYSETLRDFLTAKKYQLCDSCNEHLAGRVLNVFRCDNIDCKAIVSEAPAVLDFLDEAANKHFTNILEALDELAVPYQLNPGYVAPNGHGQTNFSVSWRGKGQNMVIGEGGYHNALLQSVCGKNLCCFGFVGSLNAVRKILELSRVEVGRDQKSDVFLVPLGELASKKSLRLFRDLTGQKIAVYDHFGNLGVKNQLKQAETFKAPIALIIGQKEAVDEMVILRDVKSGMQEVISYDKIVEEVKKRLGR